VLPSQSKYGTAAEKALVRAEGFLQIYVRLEGFSAIFILWIANRGSEGQVPPSPGRN
jgi:hypothetical protein